MLLNILKELAWITKDTILTKEPEQEKFTTCYYNLTKLKQKAEKILFKIYNVVLKKIYYISSTKQ